jgi:hypothetical protein
MAKEALQQLNFPGVMDQHAKLIEGIATVGDRETAGYILEGIRMAMYFNCEETWSHSISVRIRCEEIAHLSARTDSEDEPLIPRTALPWAQAWQVELTEGDRKALGYRQSMHLRHREHARRLSSRGPILSKEKGDYAYAKLIADSHADLIRSVRRCRGVFSAMKTVRGQYAETVLPNTDILTLLEHPEMSSWSSRRTFARLAFEIADRAAADVAAGRTREAEAKRADARKYLNLAHNALSDEERRMPLADLEAPLIEMELEFAREDADPDLDKVKKLKEQALATFTERKFHRRLLALEARWPEIEKHGHRA